MTSISTVRKPSIIDHLVWLVPAVILLPVTIFALMSSWVGNRALDPISEALATLSALGVTMAGLFYYVLHRTRLSLLLALSFLAAALINIVHVVAEVSARNLSAEQIEYMVSTPDLWTAERGLLALLMLVGIVFDRFAPVARRALVEALVATVAVVLIAAVTLPILQSLDPARMTFMLPGIPRPIQLGIGAIYLVALPFYFQVYRRERNPIWGAVVVSVVVSTFAQLVAASSATEFDAPYLVSYVYKVVANVAAIAGFPISGTLSEHRALDTARRRRLVLQVAEVASQSGIDIESVAGRISEAIAEALQLSRVSVLLFGIDGQHLDVIAGYDARRQFVSSTDGISDIAAVPDVARTIRDGKVRHVLINRHNVTDAELLGRLLGAGFASVTFVPLITQGRTIGALAMSSYSTQPLLSQVDEAVALAIASQVAAVLEMRRLLSASEEQAHQQAILYEATASLNTGLEPEDVLTNVAEQMRQALNATVCTISDWDRPRDIVVSLAEILHPSREDKSTNEGKVYRLIDYPRTKQVLENQQPVTIHVDDLEADSAERKLLKEYRQQTLLMLPLIDERQTVGLIHLYDDIKRVFDEHEINLAQALSRHAGVALQRARLYELERERSARLSFLNWLSTAFTQLVTDTDTLQQFAQRLSLALSQSRAVMVYLSEPGRDIMRLKAQVGISFEIAQMPVVRSALHSNVNAEFSPENPVTIVSGAQSPYLDYSQAVGVQDADGLGGFVVYIEDRPVLLTIIVFPTATFPDERDADFLRTISVSLTNSLTAQQLFNSVEAERERLRAILASTSDAVILVSPQAELVLVNPAAERIFDVNSKQAIGQTLNTVLTHDAFETIAQHIHSGEITDIERTNVVLSDGRAFIVSVTPVLAAGSELRGYVIDVADVTELQTLSEQRSQMLRMASHDLRNPLSQAFVGFEMLAEDMSSSEVEFDQVLIDNTRDGFRRMDTIINDFLEIERAEAGVFGQRETIDPASLIRDVVAEMEALAAVQEHTLHVEVAPDMPRIAVSVTQVHQALHNLIDNAIKYTPSGGAIKVSASADNEHVRISVIDNGVGIPQEAQEHLFERFYRAHQPGTEGISGTGLGLNLVKSVVEWHSGTVEVESEAEQGATFTIILPIAAE